jgi:hypothetical protein
VSFSLPGKFHLHANTVPLVLGSFAFSGCFAFAAFKWDYLRAKLQKLIEKSPESSSEADRAVSIKSTRALNEADGDDLSKPAKTGGLRFRIVRRHREKHVEEGDLSS